MMKMFIWIFSISFGICQISFLQAQSTAKQTVYCLYNYDVECSVTCKMVGFKSGDCHLGRCRCCADSADQKNSTQMLALSGLAIMNECSHCHNSSSSEATMIPPSSDKTANVAKLSEQLQQLGVNTLDLVVDHGQDAAELLPPAPPGDRVELEIQKIMPELVHFMSRLVRKIIKSCATSTPVLKTSTTTTDKITSSPGGLTSDRHGDHGHALGQVGQVSHVCSICSSKFHPSGNQSGITPPYVCPTCFKKLMDIGAHSTAESTPESSLSSTDEKTRVCTFCSTKLKPVGTELAFGPPYVCPTCLRKLLQTDGENTEPAGPDPTHHPPTPGLDDSGPLEKVAPTSKPAPAMHVCSICSHEFLRVESKSATTGPPDICPTCLAKSLPIVRSDDLESVELRAAEEPAAAAPAGTNDHSSRTCSICSKRYWPLLKSELPPGPPYICPTCYEKSQPVTEQSDHSSKICSICSKRYWPLFGNKQPPGPPYICPDCFKKSQHLDRDAALTLSEFSTTSNQDLEAVVKVLIESTEGLNSGSANTKDESVLKTLISFLKKRVDVRKNDNNSKTETKDQSLIDAMSIAETESLIKRLQLRLQELELEKAKTPGTSDVVQTTSKPELQGLLADMLLLIGGEFQVNQGFRTGDNSSSSIDSSSELLSNVLVKLLTEMESEDFSSEVPDKAGSSNKTVIDKLSRNELKRLIEFSLEHQEKMSDEEDKHSADDGVESTPLTRPDTRQTRPSPIELQSQIEKHPEVMAQSTPLPSTHHPDPPIESNNQTQKPVASSEDILDDDDDDDDDDDHESTSAEKLRGGGSMDKSGTSKEWIGLTKEEIEKKFPPRLMEKIDFGINRILRDFLLEARTESQQSITTGRPTDT